MRNEECGKPPKKFEDSELQALLDEDDAQTQQQIAMDGRQCSVFDGIRKV